MAVFTSFLSCLFLQFNTVYQEKDRDKKVISRKGQLTLASIDKIQNFYGLAFRKHKVVCAVLKRSSGTTVKQKNEKCPIDSKPWCIFQREIATPMSKYQSKIICLLQLSQKFNLVLIDLALKHF